MRQILLHPGFHKTGTSSMQHFLWINREVLEPYFDLRMFRHMKPVVRLASLFSRTNNPLDRAVAEQKKALADAAALGRWKPKT